MVEPETLQKKEDFHSPKFLRIHNFQMIIFEILKENQWRMLEDLVAKHNLIKCGLSNLVYI